MNNDPIRVLLIEDDHVCVKMVECYLEKSRRKFEFASAGSLKQGIDTLQRSRVDVVISDLSLPDSAGMDTVHTVNANLYGVPLIVLTGNESGEIQIAAMEAGAQEYLEKGQLSSHALERTILHAIQRHQYQAKIETLLSEVELKNSELEEQKGELVKKNRRLQDLYQAAHSFVDNVSHEFRSPLNVVNDYVSLVRDAMVGPINEEQRQMLDVVSVQVDDLNNMVDDLIDVSRIESRMLRTWRRTCSLRDIAGIVVPVLKRKAETRNIQFEVDVAGNLPGVFCDAEKIVRVVINLANNAMKLADSFGKVRLWASADQEAGMVFVGVDGTGQGIPPEELDAIQQRLAVRQVDLRDSSRNFGLGLNIARELVELNLGKMEIHSEVGVGNVFSFCLPVSEPEHIMRQYLQCRRATDGTDQSIELFKCSTKHASTQAELQEVETMFQSVLSSDDLLIGGPGDTWLLAVSSSSRCGGEHNVQLADTLQAERERHDQRRLSCSLPEFEIDECGTFNLNSDAEQIMSIVQQSFQHLDSRETEYETAPITDFAVNRD